MLQEKKNLNRNVLKEDFQLPAINFSATSYFDMIDWEKTSYISPPVINNIGNAELIEKICSSKKYNEWNFCNYLCHTVAVERLVKLVTEVAEKVCGAENSLIQTTLLSRKNLQRYDTKKQYPLRKTI